MNLRYVDIKEVYFIHELIIKRAGTKAGIRDFSLLHSAVERPRATFDGLDLYKTVFDKAGALLQSLCMNHPFTDGNKRTAWAVAHKFLWDNGYRLRADVSDSSDFMVRVGNENLELPEISFWLKKHSRSI
jgi:death on curing protein